MSRVVTKDFSAPPRLAAITDKVTDLGSRLCNYVNESGQESAAIGSTTAAHEHPGLRRPQRAIPHQSAASFEPERFDTPAGGDRGSNLSALHQCCSHPLLCGPRAISNHCAATRACPLPTPNVSQPLVNTD